jgi:hypothetical protein
LTETSWKISQPSILILVTQAWKSMNRGKGKMATLCVVAQHTVEWAVGSKKNISPQLQSTSAHVWLTMF